MILRPYQRAAVDAVYNYARSTAEGNPCVVIPTGGGKTAVIATIVRDTVEEWGGRVLILAHVKELLGQAAGALAAICPGVEVGVYSAGLKRRDTDAPCIVAGIQSAYRRAVDLGRFDVVIIDEAHRIPPDGDGMYRQYLTDARVINPALRVVGLTATPYRTATGPVCAPDNILTHVVYTVGVRELIDQGYLCPLRSRASVDPIDTSALTVSRGEFVLSDALALTDRDKVSRAVHEIVREASGRSSCLVFCCGVAHAEMVQAALEHETGQAVGLVTGDTPDDERAGVLDLFRGGALRWLVNVNVLTEGFDAPGVDLVALLRPTLSPGLYYQMVGRGLRLAEGKADCLVLDFGGNVERHGPIDQINPEARSKGEGDAPVKQCPECNELVPAGVRECPACGHRWPPPEVKHETTAGDAPILADLGKVTMTTYPVQNVGYTAWTKRGAKDDDPKTLRVDYRIGFAHTVSEWVCIEHDGWAGDKARAWWAKRSLAPYPFSAENAEAIARNGGLCDVHEITVKDTAGDRFPRVVGYDLGPRPAWGEGQDWTETEHPHADLFTVDDVPF